MGCGYMNKNIYEPLVSIVIPAYNASNYLAEAIDSALDQTYKNIEIIVVNDGSNDDGATREVVEKYRDKVIYIEKPNGGSSSAMNVGIANMNGEWFSWLSHDDLYYPNKVESEIDYLNTLNIDFSCEDELQQHVIVASADLIDRNGNIIQKFSKKKINETDKKINRPNGALYLIAEPIQAGFHGCSCLIHKRAFEIIGGFDEKLRLLNDMDLWFRFYSNGYHIHYLPMVLVKGRVHAKQVSRSIGFSYHNPEQDAFWNNNLKWLMNNCSDNSELLFLYGKTAFLKTRYAEGKYAFSYLKEKKMVGTLKLFFTMVLCSVGAQIKELGKKIYLKIRA